MSTLDSKIIDIANTKSKSGKIIKSVAVQLKNYIESTDDREGCKITIKHVLEHYSFTPAARKIVEEGLLLLDVHPDTYSEIPTEPDVVVSKNVVFAEEETYVDNEIIDDEIAFENVIEKAAQMEDLYYSDDEITDEEPEQSISIIESPVELEDSEVESIDEESSGVDEDSFSYPEVVDNERQEVSLSLYQLGSCKWKMAQLPKGNFQLGDTSQPDNPPHIVLLTQQFEIAIIPVTQGLYQEVMGSNPSFSFGNDKPVHGVDWYQAIEFCNRLSERLGFEPCYQRDGVESLWNDLCKEYDDVPVYRWNSKANGFRLPTEAEWEVAAKASHDHPYAGSAVLEDVAFFGSQESSTQGPQQNVGQKTPNAWGIYDMSGLVYEWCWDWYTPLSGHHKRNPHGPIGPLLGQRARKILRGGSYLSSAGQCTVYKRTEAYPYEIDRSWPQDGFRLVRNVLPLDNEEEEEEKVVSQGTRKARRVPIAHNPTEEEQLRSQKAEDGSFGRFATIRGEKLFPVSQEKQKQVPTESTTSKQVQQLRLPKWPKQNTRKQLTFSTKIGAGIFSLIWALIFGGILGVADVFALPAIPFFGHRITLIVLGLACGFACAEAMAQGFVYLRKISYNKQPVIQIQPLQHLWRLGLLFFVFCFLGVFLLTTVVAPRVLPSHWLHLDVQVKQGDIIEAKDGKRWVIGGKDALNYPMPFRLLTANVPLPKGEGEHQVVIDVEALESSYSSRSWWSDKVIVTDVPRLTIFNLKIELLAAERAELNRFSIQGFGGKAIDCLLFALFFVLAFLREKRWALVLSSQPFLRSVTYANILSRLPEKTALQLLHAASCEPESYDQWCKEQRWQAEEDKAWNWFVERITTDNDDGEQGMNSWKECQTEEQRIAFLAIRKEKFGLFFKGEAQIH